MVTQGFDISQLKPVDTGFIEEKSEVIDYDNLICVDCNDKKAELIRGTKDYLCVDCFKKWIKKGKENENNIKTI